MSEQIPRLLATILKAKEDPDHKIIVFFVAARIVQVWFYSSFLFLSFFCFGFGSAPLLDTLRFKAVGDLWRHVSSVEARF